MERRGQGSRKSGWLGENHSQSAPRMGGITVVLLSQKAFRRLHGFIHLFINRRILEQNAIKYNKITAASKLLSFNVSGVRSTSPATEMRRKGDRFSSSPDHPPTCLPTDLPT